jgi:hypothetical protein
VARQGGRRGEEGRRGKAVRGGEGRRSATGVRKARMEDAAREEAAALGVSDAAHSGARRGKEAALWGCRCVVDKT